MKKPICFTVKLCLVTLIFCQFAFAVESKKFSETIIMIQPVSWEELQLLQLNAMKSAEALNLSEQCPTDLAGFEHLKPLNTVFKEILWTHYFWTEFEAEDGNKCLIKHDNIDFFSDTARSKESNDVKEANYEVLNTQQARVLLSAAESIGFDEKGIQVLKRHISKHNGAINGKPYKKYGGKFIMTQFMEENKPDFPYNPEYESKAKKLGVNPFLLLFESYYTKEKLKTLEDKVKNKLIRNPRQDSEPYESMSELLDAVESDLELYREYEASKKASSHGREGIK